MRARYLVLFLVVMFLLLSLTVSYADASESKKAATVSDHTTLALKSTAALTLKGSASYTQVIRPPSFITCSSGIGLPRCTINLTGLLQWACQYRLLPRLICRLIGLPYG